MKNRNLVSVVIPAYNNEAYTYKTLKSIYTQTYRPIEIILIDDYSPSSLKKLCVKFKKRSSKEIFITYIRNQSNLGPYFNVKKGISKAHGKYLIMMPHDDWWIDDTFIESAITDLESFSDCFAYISNSKIENSEKLMFNENLNFLEKMLNGQDYVLKYFFNNAHPAYSGVVLNKIVLDKLNYLDSFMDIDQSIRNKIIPDECFTGLLMLCSIGNVKISNRISGIRGRPKNPYSTGAEWKTNLGIGTFYQNFQIYKFYKKNNNIKLKWKFIYILLFRHPIDKIHYSYFKQFEFKILPSIMIIFNYLLANSRKLARKVLRFCNFI